MKQRDIYLADLNPAKGSEQQDIRPVVIISGNAMNDNLGICIICPLSTQVKNYAGCIVLEQDNVNCLDKKSELITFQVRVISKQRLLKKTGEITLEQMERVRQGLQEILTY